MAIKWKVAAHYNGDDGILVGQPPLIGDSFRFIVSPKFDCFTLRSVDGFTAALVDCCSSVNSVVKLGEFDNLLDAMARCEEEGRAIEGSEPHKETLSPRRCRSCGSLPGLSNSRCVCGLPFSRKEY